MSRRRIEAGFNSASSFTLRDQNVSSKTSNSSANSGANSGANNINNININTSKSSDSNWYSIIVLDTKNPPWYCVRMEPVRDVLEYAVVFPFHSIHCLPSDSCSLKKGTGKENHGRSTWGRERGTLGTGRE